MKVTPTYKTGYSSKGVIPVERVHSVYKTRNSTQKWKENDYITESDKLSKEEVEAVVEEIKKEVDVRQQETAMEAYERMNSTYNPLKEKLQGKIR